MKKIVILGNSGSGKSTLAKKLVKELNLSYLDLDAIAWKPYKPTVRESLTNSIKQIKNFILTHEKWVIEGCYSSLLNVVSQSCDLLIFLNPGIETCIKNCQLRPWEKHKYTSKEEQDKNLAMLINWVQEYETRQDEFSLKQHQLIFNSFSGNKIELKSNQESLDIKFSI
jgi:adenylate kinase family enzyme